MALTNRIVANVYGINGNAVDRQGGTVTGRKNYIAYSAPSTFYVAPTGTSYNGVTCNSRILVYPTGLNQTAVVYDCVETPAELVTNGI